jgi:hypothetical protein
MGAKKKSRKIINRTNIKQKKKKRVVKSHPLAKLTPSHPDYDYVEVVEDDISEEDEGVLDDIEDLSSYETEPDSDSDNITLSSYSDEGSFSTLEVPENIVVILDPAQISYTAGADGTYVASVFVSFDEVLRATDYEVRISE